MKKILVVNGPNINMIGIREKEIYGRNTYDELCNLIETYCENKNVDVKIFQSNSEGEIIDIIQQAYFEKYDGIIINAGGYTHTSIAIMDALKAVNIYSVEVHISNIKEREEFRRVNYIEKACNHSIIGQGIQGYIQAVDNILQKD